MAALVLPLETERLTLRDFAPTDLAAVRRYALDPKVVAHVLHELRTEQELTAHFSAVLNARAFRPRRAFELAIVVRRSGLVVGTCELSRLSGGVAELGYMMARRHWGRGYATEAAIALRDAAFREMNITRLRAFVSVDNEASRKVLVKAGLKWAALRRRHTHAKGSWWDCDEYELLRGDWAAAHALPPAPAKRLSRHR